MTKIADHNGVYYHSIGDMCQKYQITPALLRKRTDQGMSLKEALETPMRTLTHKYVTEQGKRIPIGEACRLHGISRGTVESRVASGKYTLEEAVSTPTRFGESGRKKQCVDHLGQEYASQQEMCAAYGISLGAFTGRLLHGWSLEKALTTPVQKRGLSSRKPCVDHLGQEYSSILKMCEAYSISYPIFVRRRKAGFTLEEALTMPIRKKQGKTDG